MGCRYCDDGEKLPLDDFATDCWLAAEARIEGVKDGTPVIWVLADDLSVYVEITYCPRCGRKLTGGDA